MTSKGSETPSPIGIIGEDAEAEAVAIALARAGHRVLYFPVNPSAAAPPEPRIERAPTLTDVAYEAEFVLAAVADTVRLRSLLIGTADKPGLGAEMKAGAVLADLGARTPRELQALLGLLGRRGVALVDAAILGEAAEIAEARSIVLLGGFPDAVAAIEPAMRALGKTEMTGPLGSAHATAALMGYLEAAHSIAREQALALGRTCGIEPDLMTRFLGERAEVREAIGVHLSKRAGLAHRIAEDREISAEIIDFAARRKARADGENR